MNALQRILQLPVRQLAGLAIAIAAVVAMMVGVYVWSETPDYKVLYNNLGDRDGGAVVQALGTLNIPYKFSDGGNAILVPSTMVYDARLKLASQGLPKGGITGMELMENQKFGTTQFQEQVNYQRGLEGELARTIQSVSAVQAARVHLAIPKSSVFLRDSEKPSASVFLNLYPGKALDHAQVEGILHLVSSSVPELTADSVSIIDQNGTLLTRDSQSNSGLDPNQLAYVNDLEQSYTHRVLSIIEPITGRANVRAQVTADIDFSQTESTAESYKPNGTPDNAAIRSQQTTESNSSSPVAGAPTGIPGAASNQPNNAAAATAAPVAPTPAGDSTTAHKDSTTNYELDKTVQVKRAPMGAVRRLSVAIVVNNHKTTDDKGAVSMKPLDAKQIEQIEALAREAVGFSKERGDSLNVVNAAFNQIDVDTPEAVPMWKDPGNIGMAKDVGKNIMLGLLGLYLVFGLLRPAIKRLGQQPIRSEGEIQQLEGEQAEVARLPQYAENLQAVKQLARSDPKMVANVVKGWVANNG
jgi:flagellar M-ring protein FliF